MCLFYVLPGERLVLNTPPPASPAGDLAPACLTAPSVGPVAPATVEDRPRRSLAQGNRVRGKR